MTTADVTDRAGALAIDRRRDGLSWNVLVDGGYTGKLRCKACWEPRL